MEAKDHDHAAAAAGNEYQVSAKALSRVDDLLQKDAQDESLRRYKEQLLGGAFHGDVGDPNDTRHVVVEEFKVVFKDDRVAPIVYHLDTPQGISKMETTPFQLEEGSWYQFVISFRVNGSIVHGLRFQNKAKKTVLSNQDEIMLGSYAPQSTKYEFVYPRNRFMEAPSGLFYRGRYMARFKFIDDDENQLLRAVYTFEIVKKAS